MKNWKWNKILLNVLGILLVFLSLVSFNNMDYGVSEAIMLIGAFAVLAYINK